jgi:hypothetical protein
VALTSEKFDIHEHVLSTRSASNMDLMRHDVYIHISAFLETASWHEKVAWLPIQHV